MSEFHQNIQIPIPSGMLPAYIASPKGTGPHPAIIVVGGMHGPGATELEAAERLADNGFVGIVPDLFHRGPMCLTPDELQTRRRKIQNTDTIDEINATIDYLKQESFVANRIGIMGFCMGGRVSYMMAARNHEIRAAVDCYGGGVMNKDGEGPTPFETTADIGCPVLILDGETDHSPTPEQIRQITAELGKFGKVHDVHMYANEGHGFMSQNGTAVRAEVIEDAWTRIFDWFRQHVAAEVAVNA